MSPNDFFSPTTGWCITSVCIIILWWIVGKHKLGEIIGSLFWGGMLGALVTVLGRELLITVLTVPTLVMAHDYSECLEFDDTFGEAIITNTTVFRGGRFNAVDWSETFTPRYRECLEVLSSRMFEDPDSNLSVEYIVQYWRWDTTSWPLNR